MVAGGLEFGRKETQTQATKPRVDVSPLLRFVMRSLHKHISHPLESVISPVHTSSSRMPAAEHHGIGLWISF
ncbi:hypothetical protein WAI453_009649 [Rhynchosporium graminicola]